MTESEARMDWKWDTETVQRLAQECARLRRRAQSLEQFILSLDAKKCGEHYHEINKMHLGCAVARAELYAELERELAQLRALTEVVAYPAPPVGVKDEQSYYDGCAAYRNALRIAANTGSRWPEPPRSLNRHAEGEAS